jgi:outer membrane protein OmpA-like peptidoglycan-associated protein
MPANALEAAGTVATVCQPCGEPVYVATNERGKVIDIYVGEEGGRNAAEHFGSDHEEAYPEHEDEGPAYLPRGRGAFAPMLLVLAGLLFLSWIASTMYCTRPGKQVAITAPSPESEEVAAPSPTPTSTPTRPAVTVPTVIVLDSFSGLNFETDKAILTPASQLVLLDLADTLKSAPPTSVFEIRGHTDNQGSETHNKQLSYQRAETVRQFLIKQGIAETRLRAKGYGAMMPKEGASNETEEGRRKNRRIEIVEVKAALPAKK